MTSERHPHPRAPPGRPSRRPAQRHPGQPRHRPQYHRRGTAGARHGTGAGRRPYPRPLPPGPGRPAADHRLGRRDRQRWTPGAGWARDLRRSVAADRRPHRHRQDVPSVRRRPRPPQPRSPPALGSSHHGRPLRAHPSPRRPRCGTGPADTGPLPTTAPGRPRRCQDQRVDRGADLPADQPPVRAHAPHPHHHQPPHRRTPRHPRRPRRLAPRRDDRTRRSHRPRPATPHHGHRLTSRSSASSPPHLTTQPAAWPAPPAPHHRGVLRTPPRSSFASLCTVGDPSCVLSTSRLSPSRTAVPRCCRTGPPPPR